MNYSDSEDNITDFVIFTPEPEFTVSQMIGISWKLGQNLFKWFPKFIVGLIEIQSNIRNLGNMGNVNKNADVNDKQAENKDQECNVKNEEDQECLY